MKICTICNLFKKREEFSGLKRSIDGLYPQCKECKRKADKSYYEKNRDKVKDKANEYYSLNKDRILLSKDKEKLKEYNKQYKKENKEKIYNYNQQYRLKYIDQIKAQRQDYRKNNRNKINNYARELRKKDPILAIKKATRNRINEICRNNSLSKLQKYDEYIGCTDQELREHLQKQFKSEMNWENYGTYWSVDHILALSNAQNENKIYELSHYTNLRPLKNEDNFRKNSRSDICWQKLQRDRLLNEDIKLGCPLNTCTKDFILSHEKITDEHRDFIKRYEWLGTIGFGVRHVFTARYNGLLGGIVMISEPNGYQFDKKLEALIQRGACASWTPKNLASRLIMFSCRWMIKNTSKRIFTAYSDYEAGEIGTIYQACNFDYLGRNFGNLKVYKLPNGKLVGDRHFTRTSSMKKWAKELNIVWENDWCKLNGFQDISKIPKDIYKQLKDYAKNKMKSLKVIIKKPKGKYVLLLKANKREKIIKSWIPLPYPKR